MAIRWRVGLLDSVLLSIDIIQAFKSVNFSSVKCSTVQTLEAFLCASHGARRLWLHFM